MTEEKVTVKQLDALVEEIFETKATADFHKKEKEKFNKRVTELETKLIGYLKATGRSKGPYSTPWGTVSIQKDETVRMPESVEAKNELFAYLKSIDAFDTYATVNYQSLNSFFKIQREQAKKEGTLMNFKIPGLALPTSTDKIFKRKK